MTYAEYEREVKRLVRANAPRVEVQRYVTEHYALLTPEDQERAAWEVHEWLAMVYSAEESA